jgi:hypothetical protein
MSSPRRRIETDVSDLSLACILEADMGFLLAGYEVSFFTVDIEWGCC